MELVKRKLLDEVDKHQETSKDSVLKVGAGYRREKQRKPLLCYQCNKAGHKKLDCPELARASESSSRREKSQRKKGDTVSFAFAGVSETFDEAKPWVVDSGASSHTVSDRDCFNELLSCDVKWVKLADGKRAPVEGKGTAKVTLCDEGGQPRQIQLSDALYTPSLTLNLLSVSQITKKGARVTFKENSCEITCGKAIVALAYSVNGLYVLEQPKNAVLATSSHHNKACEHVWHRRFGHRDDRATDRLVKENLATGCKVNKCGVNVNCEPCLKSKSVRTSFPKESLSSTSAVMDLVHTDVCGPVETPSVSGYRYFMTMIDDHSRYCVMYLLKQKSEVANKIEEYVRMTQNMFGHKPKVIRSDQGGEYRGQKLRDFYKREGIQAQFTAGYSPQQNGVAERKNRSLVEMARCLLSDANMHQRYWAEALNTAVYLQNILPTKAAKLSPFEPWHKVKPDVKHLRVFGCNAWVHVPKEKRKKLSDTAKQLTFVGYSLEHKAYRFLDQETQQITISRDVRFIEEPGCSAGRKRINTTKEVFGQEIEVESILKTPVTHLETTPCESE
uniref:Endonuclease n=1 Tax=Anopheles atroparvus TaxID=41427 RepID=A0AAG5D8R7_ANOAO